MPNYLYLLSEIKQHFGPISNCIYSKKCFYKTEREKTMSSFSSTEQGVQKSNAADTQANYIQIYLHSRIWMY